MIKDHIVHKEEESDRLQATKIKSSYSVEANSVVSREALEDDRSGRIKQLTKQTQEERIMKKILTDCFDQLSHDQGEGGPYFMKRRVVISDSVPEGEIVMHPRTAQDLEVMFAASNLILYKR